MPGTDGFEMAQTLDDDDNLKNTPILVYTGKDLSLRDRQRLNAQTPRIFTKNQTSPGQFMELLNTYV